MVVGFVHGFVAWRLAFRLMGPVMRILQPKQERRLPFSDAIAVLMTILFMIVWGYVLLDAFGGLVVRNQTLGSRRFLMWANFAGLIMSLIIARVEAAIRRT
jgi:hypothetical protein